MEMDKWDVIKIAALIASAAFEVVEVFADFKRGEDLDDRVRRITREDNGTNK